MPNPTPIITLTTDFGTADHFVGVMKGVIAGIAPRARVIDITHEISPYEIIEGAFVISRSLAILSGGDHSRGGGRSRRRHRAPPDSG